jgi:hypothetical protein
MIIDGTYYICFILTKYSKELFQQVDQGTFHRGASVQGAKSTRGGNFKREPKLICSCLSSRKIKEKATKINK